MTHFKFVELTQERGRPAQVSSGMHKGQYEVHVGPIEGKWDGQWDGRFVQCLPQGEVRLEKNVRRLYASGSSRKGQSWAWIDGELYYLVHWMACSRSMCLLFEKASVNMRELHRLRHGVKKIKSRRKRKQAHLQLAKFKKRVKREIYFLGG